MGACQSEDASKATPPPQSAASEGGLTSTAIREDQINLHAKKRASMLNKRRAQHQNSGLAVSREEDEFDEEDEDETGGQSASGTAAGGFGPAEAAARARGVGISPCGGVAADGSSKPERPKKPHGEGKYLRLQNVYATPLQLSPSYTPPVIPKSNEENEFLRDHLRDNFIFSGLTPQELSMLIDAMESHHAAVGDLIIEQGDIGDYFYVLQHGKVSFLVNGAKVGRARNGQSFGELALLYNSPRSATVRADTECTLFRVDQPTFRLMLANNRAQSSQENISVLRKVELFRHMDTRTLTKISDALTTVTFRDGKYIVRKGEEGKVFYIIKQGKAIVSDIGWGERKYVDQTLTVGDFFGERALLTGEKRAANVKALGDCVMLCLSKDTSEKILGPLQHLVDLTMDKRLISAIPSIAKAHLEQYELDQLVRKLQPKSFKKGEVVAKEGQVYLEAFSDDTRGLYLIQEGEMTVSSTKGTVNILTKGDYFGESALRPEVGEKCWGTFTATEDTVCKMITVQSIAEVLGGIDRLGRITSRKKPDLDQSVRLDDLQKHTILGNGTFGQVWLVTRKSNPNKTYALKIQNKRDLIKRHQVKGVIREKNLMSGIDHPFVIKLINAFQDENNLFMVLLLVQGGELFSILHTSKTDGIAEPNAKFYAACVLEGLSYMHQRHILYRDLKPENVLIGNDGYPVLIDLGFAKVVPDKTYTLCGTPLYLAPEIILGRGYDKGVDHWSLAVLIYEMLFGFSPFYSNRIDQVTLFKRIVKVQYHFPLWSDCSVEALDIIGRILVLEQTERLGSLARGAADIREHPWIADMDVAQLVQKKVKPPWMPKIVNVLDASNFENWDHLEDKLKQKTEPLAEAEQKRFDDF